MRAIFEGSLVVFAVAALTTSAFAPSRPVVSFSSSSSSLRRSKSTTSAKAFPLEFLAQSTSSGITRSSTQLAYSPEAYYSSASSSSSLTRFFLETLIANGVPALCTIAVLAIAASLFRRADRRDADDEDDDDEVAAATLYNDIYGDQDGGGGSSSSSSKRGQSFFQRLRRGSRRDTGVTKNIGVPSQEYISITNINQKLQSYQYSLTAATQSKAKAASDYRKQALTKAIQQSLLVTPLSPHQLQQLSLTEKAFLEKGKDLMKNVNKLQTTLTRIELDEEIQDMGLESVYEIDPPDYDYEKDEEGKSKNNTTSTTTSTTTNTTSANKFKFPQPFNTLANSKARQSKKQKIQIMSKLASLQTQITKLEVNFRQELLQIAGPPNAASVRTALLNSVSTSLLSTLEDRPLAQILGAHAAAESRNVFLMNFPGDVSASQVERLREEVTAIIQVAQPGDEAVVVLESGGGTVTGYGLATGQLLRLKQAGLKLVIAVEQVAASGGYMMCCVADKIVASPFAVLGSIGVISDIPNVYERLKKEGIEFQTVTAGKYKRTLTPTKKVTKEDFQKTSQDVEEIFVLFRDFVAENRPQLQIEQVATGETWFGTAALDRKLCDAIQTVDDVILEYVQKGYEVLEVEYAPPSQTSLLEGLLPGRAQSSRKQKSTGVIASFVRWMVRMVSEEVSAELGLSSSSTPIEKRYMAKDDTAERTRMES